MNKRYLKFEIVAGRTKSGYLYLPFFTLTLGNNGFSLVLLGVSLLVKFN